MRSPVSPGDDDPAVGVSFDDAAGYCDWYAAVSRKRMRLPTEAEWEHACRGGTSTRYFFGDDPAAADPWLWDRVNSPTDRIPRLADKKPGPSGLVAMLGGVWEWTESGALRGGSFRVHRDRMGCDVRRVCPRETREDDISFRIARSFQGVKS